MVGTGVMLGGGFGLLPTPFSVSEQKRAGEPRSKAKCDGGFAVLARVASSLRLISSGHLTTSSLLPWQLGNLGRARCKHDEEYRPMQALHKMA